MRVTSCTLRTTMFLPIPGTPSDQSISADGVTGRNNVRFMSLPAFPTQMQLTADDMSSLSNYPKMVPLAGMSSFINPDAGFDGFDTEPGNVKGESERWDNPLSENFVRLMKNCEAVWTILTFDLQGIDPTSDIHTEGLTGDALIAAKEKRRDVILKIDTLLNQFDCEVRDLIMRYLSALLAKQYATSSDDGASVVPIELFAYLNYPFAHHKSSLTLILKRNSKNASRPTAWVPYKWSRSELN